MEYFFSLLQPSFESTHAAHFRKSRGFKLKRQHVVTIEQLILRLHDLGQVIPGDGAVIDNNVANQSPGIIKGQPAQIPHKALQCIWIRRYFFA